MKVFSQVIGNWKMGRVLEQMRILSRINYWRDGDLKIIGQQ